jgi:hypothetical protein
VKVAGRDAYILDYDHLIVAVGAETNTFGTPGVKENAYFLKVSVPGTMCGKRKHQTSKCWRPFSMPRPCVQP